MKKILAAGIIGVVSLTSVPAMAQQYRGVYATGVPPHHRHIPQRHHHGDWVTPMIIGGVIGYAITRSYDPVVVQQPPVIVQQPPVIFNPPVAINSPVCSPWIEIQQADGTITRQRTCTQ